MKFFPRLVLLAPLLPWLAPMALALEWKTQSQTVATAPFQAAQDIVFEFRNNSAQTVSITDLQTNCDCLEAQADQKSYAPATAGTIKARFTVGDRAGPYERSITVVTDEATGPIRLQVRIEVPDICSITPRSVSWALQAPSDEQVVELRPTGNLEINFTAALSTTGAFQARLETVEPGRHYRLHLVPRGTAEPASAAIRIFGRERTGHDVVVSAYATVQ
jgi:Protein of unknown function (DUF1573)